MGRGHVAIKRPEDAANRPRLTFCKRRLALLKKARKLSVLCDADVALIGFSSSGRLFEYAGSRSMNEIIQAYLDSCLEKLSKPLASSPFDDSQHEEVQGLEKELEMYLRKSEDVEELKLLSLIELEKLENKLVCELNSVRHRKELSIAEQRTEIVRKEQELLRENERLRKELKITRCGEVDEAAISTCTSLYNHEDTLASVDSSHRC